MEKKTILAKSNGITLRDHSNLVSNIAVFIASAISSLSVENLKKTLEAIRKAGLLHDIGKCIEQFQKKLIKSVFDDENLEHRHNEVGWAFLSRELNLPKDELAIVLDLVYWHHGISNEMNKHTDMEIYNSISESDKDRMRDFVKEVLGEEYLNDVPTRGITKSPVYYYNDSEKQDLNTLNTFTRTCLISADRIVSAGNSRSYAELCDEISNINNRNKSVDISNHIYKGNVRYIMQDDVSTKAIFGTTLVKAPAGFGKTLIGLLSNFKTEKKLIWVCPRNMVAESVYKSILEELEKFSVNNITVELFLGGKTKKKNHNGTDEFSSDIIITNIDNFLAPSVDNKYAGRLFRILNSMVVFDEPHELVGDRAMFACFLNLMRVRHQMTNSQTILLTATPTLMNCLWESKDKKTTILPDENTHYPAQHTKKYLLNTVRTKNEDFKLGGGEKNLIIFNSIGNSQKYSMKHDEAILIHSGFEDDKRESLMGEIYQNYGLGTDSLIKTPNVIGTHVLQASLDISFTNLHESVLSPESTIQRIGRCDRWGYYNQLCVINIYNFSDRGEDCVRDLLYSKNKSNMWFDYIEQYNGQYLTLDELYVIYNKFNQEHKKTLINDLIILSQSSLDELCKIYPKKYYEVKTKGKKEVYGSGGNALRSSGRDRFVIVPYSNDSNRYTNPFSVQYYQMSDFNNEASNSLIIKHMRFLRDQDDDRFDYNNMIQKGSVDYKYYGMRSDTPHIRLGVSYHPKYGIIGDDKIM